MYNFQSASSFLPFVASLFLELISTVSNSPGSAMKQDRVTAIGYVAAAINRALGETKAVTIVVENMVRSVPIRRGVDSPLEALLFADLKSSLFW